MNTFYCSQCKDHVQAFKTDSLWRLPPVLIIQLKRFQFEAAPTYSASFFSPNSTVMRRVKIDDLVHFEETMDFSSFVRGPLEANEPTYVYECVSVVVSRRRCALLCRVHRR